MGGPGPQQGGKQGVQELLGEKAGIETRVSLHAYGPLKVSES